jgi:hypothetical protein
VNFAVGIGLLLVAALLIYIGRPDKNGVSPRFLQFDAAMVLYPPLILVFVVFGCMALLSSP